MTRCVVDKGSMASETLAAQRAGVIMFSIMCVALVATQLNYLVVGNAHMIVVLAPMALCALLNGTVPALPWGDRGLASSFMPQPAA